MSPGAHARPEGRTWIGPQDALAALPGALQCVHCGLCASACPTYRATGRETDSPRGRILLLRAAAEGRLRRREVAEPLARCVLCRACEPACPSQVPYHELVERHREGDVPLLLRFALRRVLPSRRALAAAGMALRAGRRAGVLALVERFGPRPLRSLVGAVPRAAARFAPSGAAWPARPPVRGRVGLLLGCANGELFGPVLRDTAALLAAQGFEVVAPPQPACCGALHAHCGDADFGRRLAARMLRAFSADLDAIVVAAAGCAAWLHENDPERRVADPVALLGRAGLRGPLDAAPLRAAHAPPCHLRHVLGGAEVVEDVLRRIPGLALVDLDEAELCCGAGGLAFARAPGMSEALLKRKVERILASGAEVVLAGNPGCLLRLEPGLRRRRSGVRALHPVSLLAHAAGVSSAAPRAEASSTP